MAPTTPRAKTQPLWATAKPPEEAKLAPVQKLRGLPVQKAGRLRVHKVPRLRVQKVAGLQVQKPHGHNITKLIDDLGTSTPDANDLVRSMVQVSITRGLNAEMDSLLGYAPGGRSPKTAVGTGNHRNGIYPKNRGFSLRAGYCGYPQRQCRVVYPNHGSSRIKEIDRRCGDDCELVYRWDDQPQCISPHGNCDAG